MKSFIQKIAIIFDESELSKANIIAIMLTLAIFSGSLIIGGLYLLITNGDFTLIPMILLGLICIPATMFGINPEGTKDLILRR